MSKISNPGAIRQGSWDAGFSYNARDVVLGNDGLLYCAVTATAGTDPVADNGAAWRPLPVTRQYASSSALLAAPAGYAGQFLSTVTGDFAVSTGEATPGAARLLNSTLTVARLLGVSPAGEHQLTANSSGVAFTDANVLSLRHLNSGADCAVRFLDYQGHERGAVGYGNPGQDSFFPFSGRNYYEVSDVDNTGVSPQFILVHTGTFAGTKPFGIYGKLHLDADGTLYFYANGCNGNQLGAGSANFAISQVGDPPYGETVVTWGAYPGGCGQVRQRAGDDNHQLVWKEGLGNTLRFYEYGGTLASGQGYQFFSGGVKGGQLLRVHIADDRMQVSTPFNLKPQARPGSPLEGDCYQDSSDHHLYLYNGSAWKQLDN